MPHIQPLCESICFDAKESVHIWGIYASIVETLQ